MNTIAFFCDRNMLPGFHASLSSLLINNCSDHPLRIFLFSDGLSEKEQQLVLLTFEKLRKKNQTFEIRKAPDMRIAGANSLVGNFTTYGRLFLSELLPESDLVLYLDSDIIVNLDIQTVFEEMNGETMLFVSGTGERNWSLDNKLYKTAGLKMDDLCFNAGILGINLKKWRTENAFEHCLAVIKQYPNQFLSADQAVLNVAFHDDFKALPENINIGALATYPINITEGIYHFIGLPKPWHPLMKKYHKNYFMWKRYIDQSALKQNEITHFNLFIFIRYIKPYKRVFFNKGK